MQPVHHVSMDAPPGELFRAGGLALLQGHDLRAKRLLVRSFLSMEAPVGATLLRELVCSGGDAPCWNSALAAARCAAASAELAHEMASSTSGCGALRVAVTARLAQIELLLQVGTFTEADRLLDEAFALMRGVEDPSLEASLWWTAANVARSHGRSSTEALALSRARATGALGESDGPELLLSFAEACVEAGWTTKAVAAVRELDGADLSPRDVGRLLGLRGALVVDRDPDAAWASWARAERRLVKTEAWRPLAQLQLRMAQAANKAGRDPVPILLDVLQDRFVHALPDLVRHVVVIAAEVATARGLHDLALLAEIEVERHDANVEASWRRQAKLLSQMGFLGEAGDLMAMDRSPEVPRLPGDSMPPTSSVVRTLGGRDKVARGCRVRLRLTSADFGTVKDLRQLVERLRTAKPRGARVLRDDF